MIRKAIIPAAGLGTRLLPTTKEMPKEMLPVFDKGANGQGCVKPLLQVVFEQLYNFGLREFCFVVGRGKRAIEDHFTQDYGFVGMLRSHGRNDLADGLESFYRKLDGSAIVWINQPEPLGFGDAVLRAGPFVGNEEFIVNAGDTSVLSEGSDHIRRLAAAYEGYSCDAALLVQEVEDPRKYGVVQAEAVADGVLKVKAIEEKPDRPRSNLAVIPIYAFHPTIFKALEVSSTGKGGERQLTDGIQTMIDWGLKVYAVKRKEGETSLDIGGAETYWRALQETYRTIVT
ncbi:MAG: NTP transferase domain-containing protein [Candidatus Brockarchaeota archaeon]|nr:NTP transferase domain-containing protein [Candidatus Brockarchaeota archaeon]